MAESNSSSSSSSSSTKLSAREYVTITIALVTLLSTAFYTYLGYQRADSRLQIESEESKRRARVDERKYKVEQRDKLRDELDHILDSAFSKRGMAYLASQLIGVVPSEGGDASYEKAYLWMGHRVQNQLQIQKSFELQKMIKSLNNEIATITESIVGEKATPEDQINQWSNLPGVSATDQMAVATLLLQNGNLHDGRQLLDEAIVSLHEDEALPLVQRQSALFEALTIKAVSLVLSDDLDAGRRLFQELASNKMVREFFPASTDTDRFMYGTLVVAIWADLEVSKVLPKILSVNQIDRTTWSLQNEKNEEIQPAKDLAIRITNDQFRSLPRTQFASLYEINANLIEAVHLRLLLGRARACLGFLRSENESTIVHRERACVEARRELRGLLRELNNSIPKKTFDISGLESELELAIVESQLLMQRVPDLDENEQSRILGFNLFERAKQIVHKRHQMSPEGSSLRDHWENQKRGVLK